MRRFEETGGVYLFSPSATELADVFSQQVELLDRELYFEFEAGPATGTRSSLQATFHVGGDRVDSSPKSYVRFGFIPIVRGNHAQFFLAVFALLLLPLACQMSWNALTTHDFRSRNVRCLEEGDAEIGQRDCNMSLDEPGFESGEIVVSCPSCSRVHHARSWRLNRCECPYSDGGKGSYCYSRHMPTLLRRLLNFLCRPLGSRPDGPMFRCRCAGDEKGY